VQFNILSIANYTLHIEKTWSWLEKKGTISEQT